MHAAAFASRSFSVSALFFTAILSLSAAHGQTANPTHLDFSPPSVPLGKTSAPQTATIAAFNASYTLAVGGPNPDQFTATATVAKVAATQTVPTFPGCTDTQLKSLQCFVPVPAPGGNTPPVTLTISFRPTTAESGRTAQVLAISPTNGTVSTLITLTGTGLYQVGSGGCTYAFSDCDVSFSLLGGLEQSYLTAQDNQTNGFIRAYTNVGVPLSPALTGNIWATIRDLGAPQTNSNQNLVSAISNPDGTITSTSLATIGYSVDFLVGAGLDHPVVKTNGQYSLGPILAFGATTPLSSASATVGYTVPPLGTEECAQLQTRFATAPYNSGYSTAVIPGTPAGGNTNCLFNNAGGITPTAVTTLAFTGANRSNFLEKWEVGLRTTYRYYASGATSCNPTSPCQRGIVDFTIGQDAAITGGLVRHFVFKIDGVYPFPYTSGYLYIFGSAALRFQKNVSLQPLILAAASSTTLQSIPTPSVVVEPFLQPNKDFYRIGVGISLDRIFTALKTATNPPAQTAAAN